MATICHDMNDTEYRTAKGLNQSTIKVFIQDPLAYKMLYVDGSIPPREPTAAMAFGSRLDDYVFTGKLPAIKIPSEVLSERGERRGKAWTDWANVQKSEHGNHVALLKDDEWEAEIAPLVVARANIFAHEKAAKLLKGDSHVAVFWRDEQTGLDCKAQIDLVSQVPVLVDLKTTEDAGAESFVKSILNYGYHIQAWWYREAWRQAAGEDRPFVFVVAQSKPSWRCEVYDLDDKWYLLAEQQVRSALDRIATAYQTGRWESPTHNLITTLEPPPWALSKVAQAF